MSGGESYRHFFPGDFFFAAISARYFLDGNVYTSHRKRICLDLVFEGGRNFFLGFKGFL